jgi:hypothetical protein
LKVLFQADADLNQNILLATVRQQPGIDFQSATKAGLIGLNDQEVLALAAREGRVLVSHDLRTMPAHFGWFVESNRSPGVILMPQHLPIGLCSEQLVLIWSATEAEEWVNRICYLPL